MRIRGSIQNHALDEILADSPGQIAVFGNFDAAFQHLFFGLQGKEYTGHLIFYCRKITGAELKIFYFADKVPDVLKKINVLESFTEQFSFIVGYSIF